MKLSDIAEPQDSLEILLLKQQLVEQMNILEAAIVRGDTTTMWQAEAKIDDLTQDIFIKNESVLKPYPATAPTPLTEMEQQDLLPPEWKHVLGQS